MRRKKLTKHPPPFPHISSTQTHSLCSVGRPSPPTYRSPSFLHHRDISVSTSPLIRVFNRRPAPRLFPKRSLNKITQIAHPTQSLNSSNPQKTPTNRQTLHISRKQQKRRHKELTANPPKPPQEQPKPLRRKPPPPISPIETIPRL